MDEEFKEVEDVQEENNEIVETNEDIEGWDDPLDLGEPHTMSDEEFEDFKKSLNENKKDVSDEVTDDESLTSDTEDTNDDIEGWNDPLDLGKPHTTSDTEDTSKKDIKPEVEIPNGPTVRGNKSEIPEEEPYIKYEETEEYKDKSINGTSEELHEGFINHLRGYVNDDVKEDLPPMDDENKK